MSAGKINREWYEAALKKRSTDDIHAEISVHFDSGCAVEDDLSVWIEMGKPGNRYLTQSEINKFCRRIGEQ